MTKETFNNIVQDIEWRLNDEWRAFGEVRKPGKEYNPVSIRDAGDPDFDIWNMLTYSKGYKTRLANRIRQALKDRNGWNVEVSIIYGDLSCYPRDYNIYVVFKD